ncbi:MAG: tetratricopeptide repeat protein, partial [Armatimonadetes bacterium]|nr:tetratricopeptide repeat protein [Armatimonadota bacterium]
MLGPSRSAAACCGRRSAGVSPAVIRLIAVCLPLLVGARLPALGGQPSPDTPPTLPSPGEGRVGDSTKRFNEAVALYRSGASDKALAAFDELRTATPTDPVVHNWIGFLQLRAERYAEAAKTLEEAVCLKPAYVEAWLNLGNAYLNGLTPNEANRAFRKAVEP